MDVKAQEKEILKGLKDFQRATVDRCLELYQTGQKRILVADEVGLGKTLVAKGVIARLASWHHDLGDNLFKVVYICSNQAIASQNIRKLYDRATIDGVSDTRLSMQHLKIFEQEKDDKILRRYVQLIPLTPATSFNITNGCGSVEERALMYALLRRLQIFENVMPYLETMMINRAHDSWNGWARSYYEERVLACDQGTNYISFMLEKLKKHLTDDLIEEIYEQCRAIKANHNSNNKDKIRCIYKLRQIFALISIDYLNPDLVIMDEFQRFRELISAREDSETGLLTNRFLKNNSVKTLLLSATPYKLYQTLEEMNEYRSDDHYSEFLEVMDFLFSKETDRSEFREVWRNYSHSLRQLSREDFAVLEMKKTAEEVMYKGVCRTERLIVDRNCAILDDSGAKSPLTVSEKDILSYVEAQNLMQGLGQGLGIPVDYVKSAPYLLSFMEHYQLKREVKKYFESRPGEIRKARKHHLWLDKSAVQNYKEIPLNNARLKKLRDLALANQAERLLWIPPAKPYYELGGAFRNNPDYSKILVFSAWEMVPRMIATLLSYEAERLTVGKLYYKETDKTGKDYFAKTRFPLRRLKFNQDGAQPIFCLLYPSVTLSRMYNPIEYMGKEIRSIIKEIRGKIKVGLQGLNGYINNIRFDKRWYYLAPLLLDLQAEGIREFFEQEQPDEKMHREKLEELYAYYRNPDTIKLGRMPSDLPEVLTNMALASPAVCGLRIFKDTVLAGKFAKEMLNVFNTPEAISAIDLIYGKSGDKAYYKNVLKYAVDGNLQAVLDEYAHMLDEKDPVQLCARMTETLKLNTASYPVDNYASFKKEIEGRKEKRITMRSHFAAGFYNTKIDNKTAQRKDSLRNAFNSPFRPFVLATTSIGQEGLDFHFYCRRIVHWNLPSNPIDLEQREGRINRYKCHAIRQNLARKYGDLRFRKDVWQEIFQAAAEHEKGDRPELVPFWCLPDGGKIRIERIVPMYPLSKDEAMYHRLIKILSLYRLTLGQARQEELLEYLFNNFEDQELLKELFINLSPITRKKNDLRKTE
jgi:hypothetical protein